ncbi:MAG: cell division protein FtsZ, partial [Flavobacteriaceae bacterium]|nr:cell division protein FtsZ [Flavobacteriaceae bacterium]
MNNTNDLGNITFDLPKHQSNVIKVIGVGGGGSNAVNYMFQQGIKGVDFVICNTDSQALNSSGIPNKIQLGVNLTEGLGAGADPEIGEQAALESLDDIRSMLETQTKMIFITAGMGGGTGTGAAPIIAKMAKEMGVLTVGIVTMPFQFEGKMRNQQAQKGIENLRNHVDSLVVINNNKLREVYGNLGFKAGFSKADEVLSTAARGIAEVITHHYTQNIDLRDAKTVLKDSGTAIMGSAMASGNNRAQEAIMKALDSPLLNDNKISGAKNVLLLIVSGSQEITIDEIGEINDHIQMEAGHGANIIMGVGEDMDLEDAIAVTIIATGFHIDQQNDITNTEVKRVIHSLEEDQLMEQDLSDKEPAIITPDIVLEKEERIVHT